MRAEWRMGIHFDLHMVMFCFSWTLVLGPVYVFGFSVDKRQSVPIFAFFLAMLERRASAVLRAAALFRRICLGFALSKHSRAFRTAAFLFF